jgi:hypothetical protein
MARNFAVAFLALGLLLFAPSASAASLWGVHGVGAIGVGAGLLLAGSAIFAVVGITQVQPVNQTPSHDTFIADVTMAAGDTAATIPHKLGAIPLEYYLVPTLQGSAGPLSTVTVSVDATNITVDKSGAANMEFNFRVYAKRPHTVGL